MINKIYNKATRSINWDTVWNIAEFEQLKHTEQSKKWHKEGNVAIHTEKVVNAMIDKVKEMSDEIAQLLILSALFHDIGKGVTTSYNKERNDWVVCNHESVGENITRNLLWEEDVQLREAICYFVRNHMKPLYASYSTKGVRNLIEMSCDGLNCKFCTIQNLILLKECDCIGSESEQDGEDTWQDKLNFVADLSKEINCYDKPYEFTNEMTKYAYFNDSYNLLPSQSTDSTNFEAFIVFGTTNVSIKDIKVTNEKELRVIHNIDNNDDIIDEVNEACEDNVNMIMNLTTMNETIVETILNMIYLYHGRIVFVYGSDTYVNYLSPIKAMSTITI